MKYARIDHWRDEKGFGFIRANSRAALGSRPNPDVFVHVTQVRGKELSENQWVQYETQPSRKKAGGVEAVNVVPFKLASQDELAEIVKNAGLTAPAGLEALDMMEPSQQVKSIEASYPLFSESLAKGQHDDWMTLTERFFRSGKQAMLRAMIEVFKSNPALLDSDFHLDCWSKELPVGEPSIAFLVTKLNQGFARSNEEKSMSPMPGGMRRDWYRRFAPDTFFEVFERVNAHRITVDVLEWVTELSELTRVLDDHEKQKFVAGRVDDLMQHHFTAMDRVGLFIRKRIGSPIKEDWVACWPHIEEGLRSAIQRQSAVEDSFLKAVFVDVMNTTELSKESIQLWFWWLRKNEDWLGVIEERLTDAHFELWLWLWDEGLIDSLSGDVFHCVLDDANPKSLSILFKHVERLKPSAFAPILDEVMEQLPEPQQHHEFTTIKDFVKLGQVIGASGSCFRRFEQLILVDSAKVETWAKSVDQPWIGIAAIEPVLPYLADDLHPQVARKFFLHIEQGTVTVGTSDFKDMLSLGCSQRVPFTERMVWKQIDSLLQSGQWLQFDDVVREFVERPDGWPSTRKNPWPLLDQCQGRTRRRFDTKGFNGENWAEASRYIDVISDPSRIIVRIEYSDRHEVKSMPGIRWSQLEKLWFTSRDNEEEAMVVARKMGLMIRDHGNFWENNLHLTYIQQESGPITIGGHCIRCEGRGAYKPGTSVLNDAVWCRNGWCQQPTTRTELGWEHRTLRGFLDILGIDMSETDAKGTVMKLGAYDRLNGALNRFMQVYPHLRCGFVPSSLGEEKMSACAGLNASFASGCGTVMRPHGHSNYSHYRITHFSCAEEGCQHQGREVYLHHCLNGRCDSVIDSRFAAKCPNGWYICRSESCGSCCSDKAVTRRRRNLVEVGVTSGAGYSAGYGHKEKGEFYCSCCGGRKKTKVEEVYNQWGQPRSVSSSHCPSCHPQVELDDLGSSAAADNLPF